MSDEQHGESWLKDVNVPLILLIGVISGVLLLIIAIGAQGWYYYEAARQRQEKVYTGVHADLLELKTDQHQRLDTLRWVDEDQTRAAIPLEDAFDRYLEGQGQQ